MSNQLTQEQTATACTIINEFITGEVDVKAVPGNDGSIAWVRVYPQGEYPFAKNEAYQRLVQAGYNPQKLIEFATKREKESSQSNE